MLNTRTKRIFASALYVVRNKSNIFEKIARMPHHSLRNNTIASTVMGYDAPRQQLRHRRVHPRTWQLGDTTNTGGGLFVGTTRIRFEKLDTRDKLPLQVIANLFPYLIVGDKAVARFQQREEYLVLVQL